MAPRVMLVFFLSILTWKLHFTQAFPLVDLFRRQTVGAGHSLSNGVLGISPRSDVPLSGLLSPLIGATPSLVAPTPAASTGAPPVRLKLPQPIRGVNIGGWLVLEEWMNSNVFADTAAIDEWTFSSTPGAVEKLTQHWQTAFTQADVQKIASWGLNAMRIPIGYWAYNNTGTPYITGADAYLEQAIDWARQTGLVVLIDLHGSPGSQNGWENSGRSGSVNWQTAANMQTSISVLEQITAKYGTSAYADVVFGIGLVNEPLSGPTNPLSGIKQWTKDAYVAVKAKATNPNLQIVMHDSFQGPSTWTDVIDTIDAGENFALDTHLYQNQNNESRTLNQDQHIQNVCNTTAYLNASAPVYVGEFTAATDICAYSDGTTIGGISCSTPGCQCSYDVGMDQWQQPLKDATRRFLEAQLDMYESAATGWFIWTYDGPEGWGLKNLMQHGIAGPMITDRHFANPCVAR